MRLEPALRPTYASSVIDFGKTAADYALHRAGFPERFFDRLALQGIGRPGQAVVDVGTGTGTLARGLARRGVAVIGVDPSAAMLGQARELAAAEGLTIDFREGHAEALPLADGAVDVVTAGQCWHWFDRPRAAAEARRVLRHDGRVVLAHFDWIPQAGSVVEATEALVQAHNPAWRLAGGAGLYPAWLADLSGAGFFDLETASFDVAVTYSHEAWRGRIRASAGVAASLPPDAVARFDAAHAAMLAVRFPDPVEAPHRVWWVTGRRD